MSKVDAQRALRDARYARFAAERAAEVLPAKVPVTKPSTVKPASAKNPPGDFAEAAVPAAEPVSEELFSAITETERTPVPESAPQAPELDTGAQTHEELCGHRSMNGRSCTRVKGHEQKNHRYN